MSRKSSKHSQLVKAHGLVTLAFTLEGTREEIKARWEALGRRITAAIAPEKLHMMPTISFAEEKDGKLEIAESSQTVVSTKNDDLRKV